MLFNCIISINSLTYLWKTDKQKRQILYKEADHQHNFRIIPMVFLTLLISNLTNGQESLSSDFKIPYQHNSTSNSDYQYNNINRQNTKQYSSTRPNTIQKFISLGSVATSDSLVPFWLRSMKYGSIPLDGLSVSATGGIKKTYSPDKNKKFDWGASFEGLINQGYKTEAILIEASAQVRYSIFQFKAGRCKDMMGLVDSTLSSGAFSVSGNSLGVPKIEISIPDYWDIPFTKGLIAIKGNLAHGWMGRVNLETNHSKVPSANCYFHQKSLYGRIGKPDWKVKFYGGANDQAIWGNEGELRDSCDMSLFESYIYMFFGKVQDRSTSTIPDHSKVGNHVGSIDQAMEVDFNSFSLTGYHQFFYDAGALACLDNIKDGIFGLSYKNKAKKNSAFQFQKIVLEYFCSKSQGGEVDSKDRASEFEDYYNNFIYYDGWSYDSENMGNPLITSQKYIKGNPPMDDLLYYANNRVVAFHAGLDFSYAKWQFRCLLTSSANYGTYYVAPAYHGKGSTIVYNDPPYFEKVNQFSGSFEAIRNLKNGYHISCNICFDKGELLYDSVGGEVKLTKRW